MSDERQRAAEEAERRYPNLSHTTAMRRLAFEAGAEWRASEPVAVSEAQAEAIVVAVNELGAEASLREVRRVVEAALAQREKA